MSLIKQLWIAIAAVTILSLGGSLIVSTLSARHYLEQQLHVKNLDNATSLALSLSQMPKDPVTVELQVSAQFDAGHYRLIRLTAPGGKVLVEREYTGPMPGAPGWFARLVPIHAAPGVAQVQDGWRQFGTLTVESHSRYAYQALWDGTVELLAWFLVGAAVTGLVGTLIIKHITRPLGRVVEQAEAIGGRRFITTEEPSTREFRSVVRAMNALSERVRAMLAEESGRLEQLRRQTQHDELTGLMNRGPFLNLLDSALGRDDASATGALVIARVADLAGLNQRLGRAAADRLLTALAHRLGDFASTHGDWAAGRLNGSDFALLATGMPDVAELAERLAQELHSAVGVATRGDEVGLAVGASPYVAGEPRSHLLARVDGALAAAEQAGPRAVRVAARAGEKPGYADLTGWRTALAAALAGEGVRLARYPVVGADGSLIHHEAPARLILDGTWQTAGYFVPWAARLGLMGRIDAAVARAALTEIARDNVPLGINVSPEALCDAGFRSELIAALQAAPDAARRLWIELPEYGALRHLAEFRALCVALRPLGCKVGIEHVGPHFARIGDLHDLGLDYLKIDASITRDIDHDSGNQTFLRGLCTIAHSIGLLVIAEGVSTDAEKRALAGLGMDGMTGPHVKAPSQAERAPD